MSHFPQARHPLHRLRFIFEGSAPLLLFVPNVTSGDIAGIWSGIADHRPDRPVAIDVTFASDVENGSDTTPTSMSWLPAHLAWGRDSVK